jgi:hypothetical protein
MYLRAHMAEFGMVAPQGLRNVELLTKIIAHEFAAWLGMTPRQNSSGGKDRGFAQVRRGVRGCALKRCAPPLQPSG